LTSNSPAAEPLAQVLQRDERRHGLAEADDVVGSAHGQQLAVAPQVRWSLAERGFGQGPSNAGEIVADEERLAGARQVVQAMRFVTLARVRTLEVSDEGRPIGGEVLVVQHGHHRKRIVRRHYTEEVNLRGREEAWSLGSAGGSHR
jgi:hypothetical protein